MKMSIYYAELFLEALKNKEKVFRDEVEKIFGSDYEKNMALLECFELYKKESDYWIKIH